MSGRVQLRSFADEPLVRLVDRIYQGATDAAAWPGIVRAIAEFVDAPVGRLFTPFDGTDRGGLSISCGISESHLPDQSRHAQYDGWIMAGIGKGLFCEGCVLLDADLASASLERPYAPPATLDRSGLCSGVVFDHQSPAALPTVFNAYREQEARPFGEAERRRMQMLLPHLSRALRVLYRLRNAEQKAAGSLAALDRLACGVFLVDAAGGILHLNREAERILGQGDGLALRRETARARPRLAANDPGVHNALKSALAVALDPHAVVSAQRSSGIEAKRASGRRPYLLHVTRLPGTTGFAAEALTCAIILVNDPEARVSLDPGVLQQVYGVTPAEARLTKRLLAGDTLAAAAARCGIAETTARTQLRSLFQKTGTRRQAELMRLLVSLGSNGVGPR